MPSTQFHQIIHASTVTVLEQEVEDAAHCTILYKFDDMLVLKRAHGLHLALELLAFVCVNGDSGKHDFQCGLRLILHMFNKIDRAHATLAQLPLNLVIWDA